MMYHLKALIAVHRAKLAVAVLGYALYSAIDPASSAHAAFAYAAVILMGLFVFIPAMFFAAHVDRVKPGTVKKPFKAVYVTAPACTVDPTVTAPRVSVFSNDVVTPFITHNRLFDMGEVII